MVDYVRYTISSKTGMDTSRESKRKEYPEEFGNGVHLGEEKGVDHEIT